jgi:hypothetical protein
MEITDKSRRGNQIMQISDSAKLRRYSWTTLIFRLPAEPIVSTHSYATHSVTRGHLTLWAIRSGYRMKDSVTEWPKPGIQLCKARQN